jgi:hypothetical protein
LLRARYSTDLVTSRMHIYIFLAFRYGWNDLNMHCEKYHPKLVLQDETGELGGRAKDGVILLD